MLTFYCSICGSSITSATADDWLAECPRCAHVVPVPAHFSRTPEFAEALRVLPAGVLALEVKFRCDACEGKLQIDARFEGYQVDCPRCAKKTRVPVWSRVEPPPPLLSAAEIEFLTRGMDEADAPPVNRITSYASG
jgi:phage FluMu protein Com